MRYFSFIYGFFSIIFCFYLTTSTLSFGKESVSSLSLFEIASYFIAPIYAVLLLLQGLKTRYFLIFIPLIVAFSLLVNLITRHDIKDLVGFGGYLIFSVIFIFLNYKKN